MQWIFGAIEELVPVILFFVAQMQYGFTVGVAVMVISTIVILVFTKLLGRTVPKFAIMSTLGVLLFAVPTLVTGDASYFQVSDTILDGAFALMLLGSVVLKRPILKFFFARIFALTDEAWRILTIRWGVLFLVLAILNEFIRLSYSTEVWSLFKLAATVSIVLFGCFQFTLSRKMRIPGESNSLGLRIK